MSICILYKNIFDILPAYIRVTTYVSQLIFDYISIIVFVVARADCSWGIFWSQFFPYYTPDIDFIDEASVLCFSCKNTFLGAGNLNMITSKFWFEYLWGPYALFLDPVLCNLRSWLHNRKPVNWTVLCASLEREWTFWDKLWIQVKKPATKESSTNNFHLAYQILVIKWKTLHLSLPTTSNLMECKLKLN